MTMTERRALEALRDPALNSASKAVDDSYKSDGYGAHITYLHCTVIYDQLVDNWP